MNQIRNICANIVVIMTILVFSSTNINSGEWADRRVWVGLDMFQSFLAADKNIKNKKDVDGKLQVVLVYYDRESLAKEMAYHLENKVREIRGIPLKAEITTTNLLPDHEITAGIFLCQKIEDKEIFDNVIQFGHDNEVITFSPFSGDVERGMNGVYIADIILPYVNIDSINQSNIKLKKFFLKISKQL